MDLDTQLREATQRAIEAAPMAWNFIRRGADRVLSLRLAQYLLSVTDEDESPADQLENLVKIHWEATKTLTNDPHWTWETAWAEFCELWDHKRVKHAKGNAVADAIQLAKSQPIPPELLPFHDPDTQLLGQTCRILAQKLQLNGKFFMACSTAGQIMGKGKTTGKVKLHLLCRQGVLAPCKPPKPHPKNSARKPTQWFLYIPLSRPRKRRFPTP